LMLFVLLGKQVLINVKSGGSKWHICKVVTWRTQYKCMKGTGL
jgi:hypothetical protein